MKKQTSFQKAILGMISLSILVGCGTQGVSLNVPKPQQTVQTSGDFQVTAVRNHRKQARHDKVKKALTTAIKNNPETVDAIKEELATVLSHVVIEGLAELGIEVNVDDLCQGEALVDLINNKVIQGQRTYTWTKSERLSAIKGEDVFVYKVTEKTELANQRKAQFIGGPLNNLTMILDPVTLEAESKDLLGHTYLYGSLDKAITIPTQMGDIEIPLDFGSAEDGTDANFRLGMDAPEGAEDLNTRTETTLTGHLLPALDLVPAHPGNELVFSALKLNSSGKTFVAEDTLTFQSHINGYALAEAWNPVNGEMEPTTLPVMSKDLDKSTEITAEASAKLKKITSLVNECQQ